MKALFQYYEIRFRAAVGVYEVGIKRVECMLGWLRDETRRIKDERLGLIKAAVIQMSYFCLINGAGEW
ncbi:hypothetical protein [Pseudomonas sp. NPDC090592]|uniref:hypothetical protein n=1 Tax=Pseudomonas sp. NPDC090592 TaxID=3364480 RepID=UPI003839D9D8